MNWQMNWMAGAITAALLAGCGSDDTSPAGVDAMSSDGVADPQVAPLANVTSVGVTGTDNTFTFAVTVASPDSGCSRYADWWEVIRADGSLAYRRVLLHSHTTEQPFSRTGGPVAVMAADSVWIRAHMNTSGYGGDVFSGTAEGGFSRADQTRVFPVDIEQSEPLPDGCAF
jgi:hypothetical protein